MRPYEEQLGRVERFLQRISVPNKNREEYEDFLWAFFQNCWHLRDWIENDTSIRRSKRGAILLAVDQSKVLAICQCIANRSKHYRLDWKPRRNAKVVAEISMRIEDSAGGGDSASISSDYIVREGKKTYRALTIAEDAVRDWKRVLSLYRL
jgi:hypothetical protein